MAMGLLRSARSSSAVPGSLQCNVVSYTALPLVTLPLATADRQQGFLVRWMSAILRGKRYVQTQAAPYRCSIVVAVRRASVPPTT
jgi:hypothetical protein